MTITSDKMYYGNYGNTAKKNAIAVIILTYFVRRNAEIGSITPESIHQAGKFKVLRMLISFIKSTFPYLSIL
jgi:hypothetical protein